MARIEESRQLGIHCGRCGTTIVLVLVILYGCICLSFSLFTRLYLGMYYCAAHMSAMVLFSAIFVVVHHKGRVRWALGLQPTSFYAIQVFLNVCYCGILLVCGVAYSLLATRAININYDHIISAALAFSGALLIGYIMGLCIHVISSKRKRDCFEPDHFGFLESPRHSASEYDTHYISSNMYDIPMETKQDLNMSSDSSIYDNNFKSSKSSLTSTPPKIKRRPDSCCTRCCKGLVRFMYWICYVLIHMLFLVFFALSAYYPCTVIRDLEQFRMSTDMYTVEVPNHKPIALYMKCIGEGPETIMYENGLGGTLYATWSFIPQYLSKEYKVCVYDRRGYGWSETYESDYVDALHQHPQWSRNNVEFFKALVDATGIDTPFYMAGHSYGGHHMIYTALKYPHIIKGLMFLDSAGFSALDVLQKMLEFLANIQPTGLISIVLDLDLFDYKEAFSDQIQTSEMDQYSLDAFLASIRSGTYFSAYLREKESIDISRNNVTSNLRDAILDKPVIFIDAGTGSDWSGIQDNFPQFDPSRDHVVIPGATHESLTMSKQYGNITAKYMDQFIQRVEFERKR